MAQLFLIRGAKQLLTLRGPAGVRRGAALQDLAVIEDGSVLIRDGLIAAVGSTRRIENLKETRGAAEVEVDGAIVMPGFIDSGLQISPLSNQASPEKPLKGKKIEEFYRESLSVTRSCLQHGTLNAQIKASAEAQNIHSDVTLLRQLAKIGDHPIGMRRTWRIRQPFALPEPLSNDYATTLSFLTRRKLAHSVEVTSTSDRAVVGQVSTAAARARIDLYLQWRGGSAGALESLLQELKPSAVYCPCNVSALECSVLSQTSATVIFSPGREVLEEQPGDAARRLAGEGTAIALSSGYHSQESPMFNMQMTVALAVWRLRLTTEQAITAATVNAAYAAGLADRVGTMEAGKRADLLVLNLSDYREIPRRIGINHVGMAIREGKIAFNRTGWKVSAA